MEHEQKGYLKDEYLLLQSQYENYDQRSLTIKGWITAGATAGIAIGENSGKPSAHAVLLIVATISICIWYLEGRWKMFQHAIRDRIRILEAFFRRDQDILEEYKNPLPFQIYHSWFNAQWKDVPIFEYEKYFRPRSFLFRFLRVMMLDFVFVPYLPIIIICAVIWKWPHG
jgi:hypothetical protein